MNHTTSSYDICFYKLVAIPAETLLGTGHQWSSEQLPLASPGALRALSELLWALAQEVTDVLGHVLNEIPTLGLKSDGFFGRSWGDHGEIMGRSLGDHWEIIVNYNHEPDFLGIWSRRWCDGHKENRDFSATTMEKKNVIGFFGGYTMGIWDIVGYNNHLCTNMKSLAIN